jgi:asparagine synthase (glutamine-hydrolysing)
MCGIAGVYHFNNSKRVERSTVEKMRDTLTHRGPDDAGIYLSSDGRVGFGTRRLKIIDLSDAAHMPMEMKAPKGSVWITHNGEIYNFRELRGELEKKGYTFRSRSDTEVILASYLEYGVDCVKRMNGMFAFAIWDEARGTLFAARDHVGVKPFYYALKNGVFYFGSEIKALLAHPDLKKELNEGSVSLYLSFASAPAPHTLFRGVKKLPPATYLTVGSDGTVTEHEYWNPARNASLARNAVSTASWRSDAGGTTTESEYIEKIRSLLKDSIRAQMVSDVPFGCFLSGGIDSSTNAALMSETLGKPVETFSIGSAAFPRYNEFKYSRLMAERLGARTHELLLTEDHLEEFLARYAFHADDPNGDQVCVPLFALSKFTKEQGVTVIQIGEGSDELFAGYGVYLTALRLYERWWRLLEKMPDAMKTGGAKLLALLREPLGEFAGEYLHRLAAHEEPFWGYAQPFSDLQKERLMTDRFRETAPLASTYAVVERFYREIREVDGAADFLKRLTYLEVKNRLPEVLLMRADKMTMAHSVEGRVPFLDPRLVELAFQIPSTLKLKHGELKYLLKRAVRGIIPDEIVQRTKQGFAAPMNEWFRPGSKTAARLTNIILNSKLKERGLLNYEYVERLIGAHGRRHADHNFRLWNLVTLSLWYDYWFG